MTPEQNPNEFIERRLNQDLSKLLDRKIALDAELRIVNEDIGRIKEDLRFITPRQDIRKI